MKKIIQNLPPLNIRKLSKKSHEKEDEIKRKLHKANQYFNFWKYQIHWNKLEWVNPRSRYKQKNPFFASSKK